MCQKSNIPEDKILGDIWHNMTGDRRMLLLTWNFKGFIPDLELIT
jgi:hypothetical protein